MNNVNNAYVLECQGVFKNFIDGKSELHVLSGISMQIKRGMQVAIMGRSGSGKSTLLQLLGGLDRPTQGIIKINGININSLSEAELGKLRNKSIGFIYQFHHLLPEFTALENIAMPLLIAGKEPREALKVADELLVKIGLQDRATHKPGKLSGGERQRIAIARSLATNPDCVLADEPTGNLDDETAEQVFALLQKLNSEFGTTFIIVTHDPQLAARMDHTFHLKDGLLVSN
jgi:lipoprotein-releasing system ATP-binding protein